MMRRRKLQMRKRTLFMIVWRWRRRRTKLEMVGSSAHSITLTLYTIQDK